MLLCNTYSTLQHRDLLHVHDWDKCILYTYKYILCGICNTLVISVPICYCFLPTLTGIFPERYNYAITYGTYTLTVRDITYSAYTLTRYDYYDSYLCNSLRSRYTLRFLNYCLLACHVLRTRCYFNYGIQVYTCIAVCVSACIHVPC